MCRVGGGGEAGAARAGRAVGDARREERERHGRPPPRSRFAISSTSATRVRWRRGTRRGGTPRSLRGGASEPSGGWRRTRRWRRTWPRRRGGGMAELLTNLSRDLDAGVARELNASAAVAADPEGMGDDRGRARGLFAAGVMIRAPAAAAAEEDVVDAVRRADRPRGGAGAITDGRGDVGARGARDRGGVSRVRDASAGGRLGRERTGGRGRRAGRGGPGGSGVAKDPEETGTETHGDWDERGERTRPRPRRVRRRRATTTVRMNATVLLCCRRFSPARPSEGERRQESLVPGRGTSSCSARRA